MWSLENINSGHITSVFKSFPYLTIIFKIKSKVFNMYVYDLISDDFSFLSALRDFFFSFIEVELIYNVVIISVVQQSDLVVRVHTFILF